VPPNSCNGTGECCVEANCPGGCPTPQRQSQNAKISAVTILEAPVSTDGQAGRSAAILGTRALIGAPNGDVQGNPLGVAYYISNIDTSPNNFQTIAPNPPSGSGLSGNSFSCGHYVTLSERYVVVGCPEYKRLVGRLTENVSQYDYSGVYTGNNTGAILINDLNSGISGTTTILSPQPEVQSEYGTSVSINNSGLLAVGTRNIGRVYIHNLNDSYPSLPRNSLPGAGNFGSSFGWSVALGDDGTLVVGAPEQNGKGAVYLYRNGNFVNSPVTLTAPSSVSSGGKFGFSVALYGKTLVVGAPESSVAGRVSAGTAFTYDLNLSDDDLVNQARVLDANPNEGAEFGRSVSITSGAIVVGSRGYEQDQDAIVTGAVFFYNQKTNGDWYRPVIEGYTNPIIGAGSQYGDSVAIGETAFLVGVPKLNGQAGAVYAYFYTSSTSTVTSPSTAPTDTPTLTRSHPSSQPQPSLSLEPSLSSEPSSQPSTSSEPSISAAPSNAPTSGPTNPSQSPSPTSVPSSSSSSQFSLSFEPSLSSEPSSQPSLSSQPSSSFQPSLSAEPSTSPAPSAAVTDTDTPTLTGSPSAPCDGDVVTVTINTDDYPGETTWRLMDKCQDQDIEVQSGGPYSSYGTVYIEEICVSSGEYEFIISDSYGDGICCDYDDGSYSVEYKGETVASGGDFGFSESSAFGSCATLSPAPSSQPSLSFEP
ncbi:hypothetical protein ACHAWC_003319, partial [Mediolabrus comicus]